MYQDIILQCSDCGCNFQFTSGEQEFFNLKGLTNNPKRCSNCRNHRKRSSDNRKPMPRVLYDVICSNCGKNTQVPFKPSYDKPVYCKECFESMKVASYK